MKKVNLFLIWTEYHLFTTISLIMDNFNDSEEFENLIVHPSRPTGSRIPADINLTNNAKFIRLVCLEDELVVTPDLKKQIIELINRPITHLVTFHEEKPLAMYFINKLNGKAKITLGPDGNQPYIKRSRESIKRRFKKKLKMQLWLWMHGLVFRKIYTISSTYASFSEVDEVLITEPAHYENTSNKGVIPLKILHSSQSKEATNHAFGFDFQ